MDASKRLRTSGMKVLGFTLARQPEMLSNDRAFQTAPPEKIFLYSGECCY